ncbi:CHAT domain-containing protein [Streptomyces sp. NPDC101150]|uniref:CHAT domain-containing protein n=1 Tax=Streptomyces sp. NPDC101150 TaxID=3366114 RepID=UPI00382C1BF5
MSEVHLAAVRLRLRRIDETGDTGLALEPEALAEAERTARLLAVNGDLPDRVTLGRLYFIRAGALPADEACRERRRAVDILRPCFLAGTAGLPADLLPELADATATEASAMLERAVAAADPEALARCAGLWRRILDAAPKEHRHRVRHLSQLALALRSRFRCTGTLADLDEALDALRAAVAGAADDPVRYGHLVDACTLLQARFTHSHDVADLDGAIAAGTEVVERAPAGFGQRPVAVSNVAGALRTRAQHTGSGDDVDRAIDLLRSAVGDFPANNPSRISALANLATALRTRYQQTGGYADLDASVATGQEVLTATAAHHPQRAARLANLGLALLLRFDARANAADLYAAIDLTRSALAAMPAGAPIRPSALNHLGLALWSRFLRTQDVSDLAAAVTEFRSAAGATSAADPARAPYLANLGNALRLRFAATDDRSDLDEAIATLSAAAAAAPAGLPEAAAFAAHLGDALDERYRRTRNTADRDAAVAAYSKAADGAATAPTVRAVAARSAGRLLADDAPGRAADLLEMAVRALPEMAPRTGPAQPARGGRPPAPDTFAGLPGDAAALALADPRGTADERAARALRLLEAGRAVLLGQALDTGSDLTELRPEHPEAAARFCALRDRLDRPSGTGGGRGLPSADPEPTAVDRRRLVAERHHLAAEFARTLATVRALDGFASFGRPPTTAELVAEAAHGPVVVFNITPRRSDALLLTRDGIRSVPLPALRHDTLTETVTAFHQQLRTAAGHRLRRRRRAAQLALHAALGWLWDAAAEPVLRALGHLGPPPPGVPWPRVWWVPGGVLGLLPLHAAGHHCDPAGAPERRTVLDRVVSSYTPSVRALREARQRAPAPSAAPPRALVVAMPTTPGPAGGGRPDRAAAEAGALLGRLEDAVLLLGTDDAKGGGSPSVTVATRAKVLEQLPGCPLVHFACHAVGHPTDPSQSRLLLHDDGTVPFTVASLAALRLDGAQLAYLSTCHAPPVEAAGPAAESVHLTSAFQLAGFPHVIGTLWAVDDKLAVTAADTFYSHLRTDDRPLDTRRSALALHHTVRSLRDRFPRAASLWGAYLHTGA